MFKKNDKNPDEFWREYEEKTGEKVLARSLGQYMSGWKEFGGTVLWGLVIATSGGFRFHHFPQMSWLDALLRFNSDGKTPREKTIFIPKDRIVSAEFRREKRWWKKIICPSQPLLVICYKDETGETGELLLQVEYKTEGLAEQLF